MDLTYNLQPEIPEDFEANETVVDEELVELAKVGDAAAQEYLINKYKNFVRAKARSILFDRRRPRGHYSGRYDRSL
jgi:RNA polymerase sporulation-specific sigma factor